MKKEQQTKQKKGKKASDIVAIIVMIVAIGVFAYAAFQLFQIFREYKAGEDEYDALREYVQVVETDETEDTVISDEIIVAEEIPQCPITVDFASLKRVNEDVVGWIYIEAIPSISYPIVQGDDNEYYLKHTVEKVKNSSASIFMDYRNSSDFTDSNTIIYGHNMKNQSMFGILGKLKEQEVYDKSPYIWIITENEEICYEVFSARNVPETDALYNVLNESADTYKTKLNSYMNYSEISCDMTFDGTEKIITLSTCTSNDTVRCVVQAVRKDF